MSNLERKIELLNNSSQRLGRALGLTRDNAFWRYIRQEAWIHFKRSAELLWMVLRRKD